MYSEHYAIDLNQLKIFISQAASCKINEVFLEDFKNSYDLSIDVHSPHSLYTAAEVIEKRLRKQYFLEPNISKANLMNRWHLG